MTIEEQLKKAQADLAVAQKQAQANHAALVELRKKAAEGDEEEEKKPEGEEEEAAEQEAATHTCPECGHEWTDEADEATEETEGEAEDSEEKAAKHKHKKLNLSAEVKRLKAQLDTQKKGFDAYKSNEPKRINAGVQRALESSGTPTPAPIGTDTNAAIKPDGKPKLEGLTGLAKTRAALAAKLPTK